MDQITRPTLNTNMMLHGNFECSIVTCKKNLIKVTIIKNRNYGFGKYLYSACMTRHNLLQKRIHVFVERLSILFCHFHCLELRKSLCNTFKPRDQILEEKLYYSSVFSSGSHTVHNNCENLSIKQGYLGLFICLM